MNTEINKWWGYIHSMGGIHIKRFFDIKDLEKADESPLVYKRTEILEANTREEAIKKVCSDLGVIYNPYIHK